MLTPHLSVECNHSKECNLKVVWTNITTFKIGICIIPLPRLWSISAVHIDALARVHIVGFTSIPVGVIKNRSILPSPGSSISNFVSSNPGIQTILVAKERINMVIFFLTLDGDKCSFRIQITTFFPISIPFIRSFNILVTFILPFRESRPAFYLKEKIS